MTQLRGCTLITAPANVFTTELEKALHANEHFLWMQGRFVGAEKANRNGAFWTTEDLELGERTVRHGPLNWLHEARHVIGTIATPAWSSATSSWRWTSTGRTSNKRTSRWSTRKRFSPSSATQ